MIRLQASSSGSLEVECVLFDISTMAVRLHFPAINMLTCYHPTPPMLLQLYDPVARRHGQSHHTFLLPPFSLPPFSPSSALLYSASYLIHVSCTHTLTFGPRCLFESDLHLISSILPSIYCLAKGTHLASPQLSWARSNTFRDKTISCFIYFTTYFSFSLNLNC